MLTETGSVTKGLIIREPWISMILKGTKTWEMRTKAVSIRGPIALIKGGSGTVVGVANLVDSLPPLSAEQMLASQHKHGIGADKISQVVADGWVVPWVLEQVIPIEPVPYAHPNGAVTWVNLEPEVTAAIAARVGQPACTAAASATSAHPIQTQAISAVRSVPAAHPPRPLPAAPTCAGADAVLVPITGGNIRNHHINLRSVPDGFFPASAYGASNKDGGPGVPVQVKFTPGPTVETDIAGDKRIFRDRAGTRAFYEESGAEEGDQALIERRADGSFAISLVRK